MGFFDLLLEWTNKLDLLFWGPGMIALLLLTGIILTFATRGLQFTHFWTSIKLIFSKESRSEEGKGDISPFAALMTALAATVGNGDLCCAMLREIEQCAQLAFVATVGCGFSLLQALYR